MPDPTALDTFERSRIDWEENSQPPFAAILAETRDLLATRRRAVLPLMNGGFLDARYARHGTGGLEVEWRFEDGTLRLTLNVGDRAQAFAAEPGETVIWQSRNVPAALSEALGAWTGRITTRDAS